MTSLKRLLTTALAVALLLPAAAHASSSMETGIADDARPAQRAQRRQGGRRGRRAWAALGIDDVRIFVQWQAHRPRRIRTSRRPTASTRPIRTARATTGRASDRAVEPGQRRGHAPAARGHRPGPAVGLAGARAPQRPLQAAPRPLRAVRARGRAALRRRPSTAGSSGTSPTCRCGCSRRTRARASAARRTPRTSTAAWCAPPTRRSRPSTRPRPCSSARWRRAARTRRSRTPARCRWPSSARWGASSVTLKRDRSGPCKGFQPLTGRRLRLPPPRHDAARPTSRSRSLDEAAIGDLPRLERTLDATQRAGGLRKPGGGKFGLYFTEWGYQTRPPDPIQGVSLAKQSRYLQQGAYIAYKDPRVQAADPVRVARRAARPRQTATKYSGLAVGPALRQRQGQAVAEDASPTRSSSTSARGSRTARLWGQVRPGNGHQRHRAAPQARRQALDDGQGPLDQRLRLLEADPDAQGDDRLPLHLAADRRVRRAQRPGAGQRRAARRSVAKRG